MITRAENIAFLTAWQSWRQGISRSHLMPMTDPEELNKHIEFAIHSLKEDQASEWNEKRIDVIGQNGNVGYD